MIPYHLLSPGLSGFLLQKSRRCLQRRDSPTVDVLSQYRLVPGQGCVLEYCNFIFAIYSLLVLLFYYDISKLSVKFTWYFVKYTCIFTNFSFSSLRILICFTKMQQLCSKKNLKSNFEISLIFAGRFVRQSH